MNNNSTLPFTGDDNFDDVATWLRALHGILVSLLLLFGICGNGAVILLVIFNKNLHYRSIVVSLGLVVADFLVALEWNLSGLASTAAGEWPFGDLGCTVLGTIHLCLLYVRWLEIAVITLDRFFIILSPFNYYKYSKPLQVVATIIAWIVPAIIIATPTVLGVGMFRFRLTTSTCTIDCFGTNPCYLFYLGVFAAFVTVGGVLPTVLYSIMYCIGRRKRSTMAHSLGTVERESSTVSSGESSGGGTVVIPQVVRPPSNRNTRLKDSEKRALVTFFIIFVTLLLTQIPIFITSGVLRNTSIFDELPVWVHFISMYVFLLSPVFTPFVIMRNKDFRRVLGSIIKRTRTMPLVTERQIREFRRNSSVAYLNDESGRMEMFFGRKQSLQLSNSGMSNGLQMKTVIEEESEECDSVSESSEVSHTEV